MPVNKFGDSGDDSSEVIHTSSNIGITLPQINNVFLRRDGANNATGDINMSGHKVTNISTPTEGQDAANKTYVDQTTVSKTGDVMTGNLIMRVGNSAGLSLGCNDLRGDKRFNLLLGSTSDLIHNKVGQPITVQSFDGIALRVGDNDIAEFKT